MLKIIGATHPGKVRENNQDAYTFRLLGSGCGYAVVCDGMGGERAGDIASQTACQLLTRFFDRDLMENMSEGAVKAVMFSAISAANAKVYSLAKENKEYSGMGTTLSAAVIMGEEMHIVNIGDSRIYIGDKHGAVQVTKDHTMVQAMVDRGEITPQEAKTHPRRHLITRAVGIGDTLDIDYQMFRVGREHQVLLCSDGLSNYASEQKLWELMKRAAKEGTAQCFVAHANQMGGSDNVTAVLAYQS